jgi:hypothetical protein
MSFRTNILFNSGTEVKILRAQSTDNTVNSVASNSSFVNNVGVSLLAHATARTLVRYGIALGGYGELLCNNGDSGNPTGFIIGSDLNIPILFGTNNLFRMTLTGGGNLIIGATSGNTNAILELVSTSKAFIPPKMTTAQRDAIGSPVSGMVVYNTSTNVLNFYNGSAWGAV